MLEYVYSLLKSNADVNKCFLHIIHFFLLLSSLLSSKKKINNSRYPLFTCLSLSITIFSTLIIIQEIRPAVDWVLTNDLSFSTTWFTTDRSGSLGMQKTWRNSASIGHAEQRGIETGITMVLLINVCICMDYLAC